MSQIAANLQRIRNGQRRYAITPRIPGGFVQPALLQKFIDVANKYKVTLKITGAQRIMITGLRAEDVNDAWTMLGMKPAYTVANRVRSVTMCPGTTFCKRAKQDSVKLGMQLEKKYTSLEMPSKVKISVSGCPNSCTEGALKDIGIIGSVNGWSIYAGGSGGAHPRLGKLIAHVPNESDVLIIVDRMINYYKEQAHIERVGEFIDRIGLETFKQAVLGPDYMQYRAPAESESTTTTSDVEEVVPTAKVTPTIDDANAKYPIITPDTIIRDIVDTYPDCVPILQDMGMGCLGCPSSTAEPLSQAAHIHGVNVYDLVSKLNSVRATLLEPDQAKPLQKGEPITKDTIIRDIVHIYPEVVPYLQDKGMGCLGCPSSTAEPLWQAAQIHGFDVIHLVDELNERKGA